MIADADSEKSGRVMRAMLRMKKLDLAALQRTYDGTPLWHPARPSPLGPLFSLFFAAK